MTEGKITAERRSKTLAAASQITSEERTQKRGETCQSVSVSQSTSEERTKEK